MAAFSPFEHQSFTPDSSSLLLPNFPVTINGQMCSLLKEPNNANSIPVFPQFYQTENHLQNLDESAKVGINNRDNSVVSVANKYNVDCCSSIVTDEHEATQKVATKRTCKQGSSANSVHSKVPTDKRSEFKEKKRKKMKSDDQEKKAKKEKKPAEEAPAGYILVRARRGQATDSHSLAERARRERLRERMKMLQALVPGCDQVTGKVLMLDEIIKYVKSLQNQVEFLSMKLASVDPLSHVFGVNSESFRVRPDQDLSNLNHYHPLENFASSLLFSQAQNPSVLPQVVRSLIEEKKRTKASLYILRWACINSNADGETSIRSNSKSIDLMNTCSYCPVNKGHETIYRNQMTVDRKGHIINSTDRSNETRSFSDPLFLSCLNLKHTNSCNPLTLVLPKVWDQFGSRVALS